MTPLGSPVVPDVKPGEIRRQFPSTPPTEGESFEAIFEDFTQKVVPGMSHWQHPGWFAYFPANSSPPSLLAEMLTATLAVRNQSINHDLAASVASKPNADVNPTQRRNERTDLGFSHNSSQP